jgi:hypothetical protein
MDGRKISNIPSRTNWNRVKWFTGKEDFKAKKYSYIWAKYSLEDKQDPVKELSLEKLAKYLLIAKQQPEHLQIWFWDETGFSLRVIDEKLG